MIGILKKKINCYCSIDTLPVHNWFKINETNNLKWLVINHENIKLNQSHSNILSVVWQQITDEFFDVFGIPDKMKKILETERDLKVMKWDLFLTGNRALLTFIEIKELQLENLSKNVKVDDPIETKINIEKYMRMPIDFKVMTVKEFYVYVNRINKEIKAKQNGGK